MYYQDLNAANWSRPGPPRKELAVTLSTQMKAASDEVRNADSMVMIGSYGTARCTMDCTVLRTIVRGHKAAVHKQSDEQCGEAGIGDEQASGDGIRKIHGGNEHGDYEVETDHVIKIKREKILVGADMWKLPGVEMLL